MKRYAVVAHPGFQDDVRRETGWWAERNPSWADVIVDVLDEASVLLRRFPEIGPPVLVRRHPEANARHLVLGRTGYILFYEVQHDHRRVVLIRLRHEKQRPLRTERRRPPQP
jgi:plasmid stabilization system protein ParE